MTGRLETMTKAMNFVREQSMGEWDEETIGQDADQLAVLLDSMTEEWRTWAEELCDSEEIPRTGNRATDIALEMSRRGQEIEDLRARLRAAEPMDEREAWRQMLNECMASMRECGRHPAMLAGIALTLPLLGERTR